VAVATVKFEGVGKIFHDGTRAVADFNLEVSDGQFMVLVGPSGCGKTTVLRMVAGLEEITAGEIHIGGNVVNDLDPRDRDLAMVFQNYALYPHMTVYENISFGLSSRKVPRKEIQRRVEEISRVLGLHDMLQRKPRQLSGGQRQRVAMGRAIVREPQAFLMDEPLSNLDAKLRVQMRAEISRIQRELGATTIYVTHDQIEAMTMGDRVAVMRKGVLQQIDLPQRIYDAPANLFVASFIGSPAMNLVEAVVERSDGELACRVGEQVLALPSEVLTARPALNAYVDRTIALGIRPEQLQHAEQASEVPGDRRLRGRVLLTEALGSELLAHVEVEAKPVLREEVLEGVVERDEAVVEALMSDARARRMTFVGRFDSGLRLEWGEVVEMVVDTNKLHFFDLESGTAIPEAQNVVSLRG
jgi:multiple sugar transport system ATP-binding protein